MNIIIFEGIATSGKSTIIKRIQSALEEKLKIRVAGEEETHIPIMQDTDKLHPDFYLELLNKLTSEYPDLIIVDRFYLTQAFRAKSDLKPYEIVEDALQPYNPLTIYLCVDPGAIASRISEAVQHRGSEWGEYVATKGSSHEERAAYYIAQQSSQVELLKQSNLPYRIFDTSSHNYNQVADKIIELLSLE